MNIAAEHLKSGTSTTVRRAPRYRGFTWLFTCAVLAVLWWGWNQRGLRLIDGSTSLGYALGIIGASMMGMMLFYSLRKRVRALARLMPFRWWFSAHMMLGIIGPVCILFHCNFSLGSTNSTVAFFAMVLMVSSGLIGRFIYSRVHHGLFGRRITLEELRQELHQSYRVPRAKGGEAKLPFDFMRLEASVMQPSRNLTSSLWRWRRTRRLSSTVTRRLMSMGADRACARDYAQHLTAIARFSFYERLFSFWHVLHIPIFFLLVVTTLFHIYAVHAY